MTKSVSNKAIEDADRIYHEWDDALSRNDVEALMRLYHPDATIESPLIPYLLKTERGICQGAKEIRKLLELVAERKPPKRKYYREKYFTDGETLIWEYPRFSPSGEQMDFVEVMKLKDGLIIKQRVYWGWFGFNIIKGDEYWRE